MTSSFHEPPAPRSVPPDLLATIRRSGVLDGRRWRKVVERVRDGRYPRDPVELARALVKGRVLTEYQVRRLLHCESPALVVGPYVIFGRLGGGSMGRVYRARHRLMGRVVALKVLAPEVASRRSARARFRREMALAGRLDHPNVVRAFDAGAIGGALYIVMECLTGRTLDEALRDLGSLEPAEVVALAEQTALGLAHAHERGVVHRDIKPSNLMVDEDGRLKILDFGIGVLAGPGAADDGASPSTDGLAIGTVEYMSPEQARGARLDGRSDLYSLGCVMYHLLTGRVPFPAASKVVSLAMRVGGLATPIGEVRPGLPAGLAEVVGRLMAPRPEDRYADAREAAEALRSLRLDGPDGPTRALHAAATAHGGRPARALGVAVNCAPRPGRGQAAGPPRTP